MLTPDASILQLNSVGQTTAGRLKKLGLQTIQDLLFYFPWRYDNFGQTIPISDLQAGTTVNIVGRIDLISNKRSRQRRLAITEAIISDDSDSLKVVWFNQPYISKTLKVGDEISLAGKVVESYGQLTLMSPIYEKISDYHELIHTQGLTPIYSLTAGLTQKQLRFLIDAALPTAPALIDWLPAEIQTKLNLLDLPTALKKIHFPKNEADIRLAKQRLGFAELFLRQLQAQLIKREIKTSRAPQIEFKKNETQALIKSLSFKLTNDQKQAAWEILQDLAKSQPMSRLLEGDVGSGKTLVAIIAMLNVALNGQQAVLMAPTEILAEQHFETLSKFLANFEINLGLLTHNRRLTNYEINEKITPPEILNNCQIIIGTQALIQDKLKFKNLALIIVDEQHRFGVEQRQKLTRSGSESNQAPTPKSIANLTPHFLSMTATPIPRSLALAIYGDLDISIIKEKPANRLPIITKIVPEASRAAAYKFIHTQIKAGRQAFVICPLIDPSDKLGVKSVTEEYQKLNEGIFPDLKIGLLHGRLKPAEKNKIMQEFLDNDIKILVATSVIEVGIDIPNATIMIIEGASRFGLAQLHQFRGRVGRSGHQSYCFLFPGTENSLIATKTRERLGALVKHQDGYLLAQEDLKLRGAGEIYGTIQSGYPELKIASLFDYALIKQAQTEAEIIITSDPELKKYPKLKNQLGAWKKQVHLE